MFSRSFRATLAAIALAFHAAAAGLEVTSFDVDATPATGTLLAYDPMVGAGELTLRCRGVILRGAGEPIVLAAIDWIGVANDSHDAFRDALAAAAGTRRQRVSLHALHQHDAPQADSTSEKILKARGFPPGPFESAIVEPAMLRASNAVRSATGRFQPLTHVGWGQAEVYRVASNRRVAGPDGKVRAVRYTSCKDPELQAAPEGVIDPNVVLLSFWNGEKPVAVLSYYATHPQSYYRTGLANPDFPGIARFLRDQSVPGVLHVHFNGAGGNIGAGKYNDGSETNRAVLAGRLADGMKRAWESTRREPITPADVGWDVETLVLPLAPHLKAEELDQALRRPTPQIYVLAAQLAFLERVQAGKGTDVACLRLGKHRVLYTPGELFVEYQLAARNMRPDLNITMAAYGDYGTAYIGTQKAYELGGYETEPRSSNVAPTVQGVLMKAFQRLLGAGPQP
jgi:hypothetical protein